MLFFFFQALVYSSILSQNMERIFFFLSFFLSYNIISIIVFRLFVGSWSLFFLKSARAVYRLKTGTNLYTHALNPSSFRLFKRRLKKVKTHTAPYIVQLLLKTNFRNSGEDSRWWICRNSREPIRGTGRHPMASLCCYRCLFFHVSVGLSFLPLITPLFYNYF